MKLLVDHNSSECMSTSGSMRFAYHNISKMTTLSSASFYIPDENQVRLLKSASLDTDWSLFSTGVQVWVGQTYLRLLTAGYAVKLTSTPPETGVVVVHADHAATLFAKRSLLSNLTVVVVRADRPAQHYSDFEVVQNMHTAGGRAHYIQHWPQPGLIPRAIARGSTVQNIAFKGSNGEMADEFRSENWVNALADEGMTWHADTAQWSGNSTSYRVNWNDYRETDVIVALRRDTSHLHVRKPASKLINAWLAGVPAILSPEIAYTELGRPGIDYLQASSPAEAFQALRYLRDSPLVYRELVRKGQLRAAEVNADAVTSRWAKLLFVEIPRIKDTRSKYARHSFKSLKSRVRGRWSVTNLFN